MSGHKLDGDRLKRFGSTAKRFGKEAALRGIVTKARIEKGLRERKTRREVQAEIKLSKEEAAVAREERRFELEKRKAELDERRTKLRGRVGTKSRGTGFFRLIERVTRPGPTSKTRSRKRKRMRA